MNDLLMNANLVKNRTEDDQRYIDAVDKYVAMFGYQPNFIALPDPTIEEILNAVETGVELYEKESTNGDIIL